MNNVELGSCASTESSVPNLGPKPRKLPLIRYFLDVCCVFLLHAGLKVIANVIGPVEYGFNCKDPSISYPLRPSTVGVNALYGYCILLPMIFVLAVELLLLYLHPADRFSIYEYQRNKWRRYLVRFAIFYGYYATFEVIVTAVTTYTKLPVGRLRPYFLEVCKPRYDPRDCTYPGAYIANYTCTGDRDRIREARLSFFSGHSSLAMGASTFVVLYLQYRLVGQVRSRVLVPVVQCVVLGCGLFVAYSRLFDFKHHWTDVLCGVAVGALLMAALCRWVAGFRPRSAAEVEHAILAAEPAPAPAKPDARDLDNVVITPNRSFMWAEAYS